jgi:uncharacterized protein
MSSPIEQSAAPVIGTVESVAPEKVGVLLDLDDPQAVALNTGQPVRFPRVNGYVLISSETGALVGLVAWLGVERSPYPTRPGFPCFWSCRSSLPVAENVACPSWDVDRVVERLRAPPRRECLSVGG